MTPLHVAVACGVGVAATATLDAWNLLLARGFGVASLDFCLLGRWVAHMPRGVVRHRHLGAAAPRRGECVWGWMAHYGIGAGLALVFAWALPAWLARPTMLPALAFGVGTVVLPFFVLQPALGFGVAAAATRTPWRARLKSLVTHTVYGLALYGWAYAAAWRVLD